MVWREYAARHSWTGCLAAKCWDLLGSGVSWVFYVPIKLSMYVLATCNVRMRQCKANVWVKKQMREVNYAVNDCANSRVYRGVVPKSE